MCIKFWLMAIHSLDFAEDSNLLGVALSNTYKSIKKYFGATKC